MELVILFMSAIVPAGNWMIFTSHQPTDTEITRWAQVTRTAEKVVEDYLGKDMVEGLEDSGVLPMGELRLRVAPSSGDFAAWTGASIWQGAAVRDGEIVVQPLSVLEPRGVTEEVLVHEYTHLVLEPYNVPLWLNEGLAVIISGQVRSMGPGEDLPDEETEIERLLVSADTAEMRRGYQAAAALTQKMLNNLGRDSVIALAVSSK